MSLSVNNLCFGYEKDKLVLDNFSASFEKGRITAVQGDNGAGKTTLARVIMGILKPSSGEIVLEGRCINEMTLAERGRCIGYVMQNPSRQIFCDTVEKEVAYGLENMGLSKAETESRVKKYLEIFELEEFRNTMPFELSGGEQQRLVLVAIMAMQPEYLILDEPTAGLDGRRKNILGRLLLEAVKTCGVVLVSHDMEFIEEYCDDRITIGR